MRGRDQSAEAGFATVWAAGAVMVLVTLLVFGMCLADVTSGRHRAEAAADLGALAAAVHVADGEAAACASAVRVAQRMVTRLVSCRAVGWEVLVEVEAAPSIAVPGVGAVRGRARAGPAP